MVLSLSLAILGVYSGTTASQRVQEVSFTLSLLCPLLGSLLQLLVPGPGSSAFLYGLLLSVTASSTNLFVNKRQGQATSDASGAFIPGRDQPTPPQRPRPANPPATATGPESATPLCVSPAQQFRSLKFSY